MATTTATGPASLSITRPPESLWRQAIRAFFRQRSAVIGLTIIVALVLIALFAPLIAPYDPIQVLIGVEDVQKRAPPCIHLLGCAADQPQHLMGTDGNVRDQFSRIVYGTRVSLYVGFITVGFAIVVGILLGAIAGYVGGWLDNLIMRILDVLLAFPSLLLAIAIVSVLGPGLTNAMLAIAIVSIPAYARVMRASVLSVKEEEYTVAARTVGVSAHADFVPPHHPECDLAADCAGHAWHRHGHSRDGGAVVPGAWRAAANRRMGLDAQRRAQPGLQRAASGVLARPGDHDQRAGLQPARRWPARCARPAPAALISQ